MAMVNKMVHEKSNPNPDSVKCVELNSFNPQQGDEGFTVPLNVDVYGKVELQEFISIPANIATETLKVQRQNKNSAAESATYVIVFGEKKMQEILWNEYYIQMNRCWFQSGSRIALNDVLQGDELITVGSRIIAGLCYKVHLFYPTHEF